MSFVSGTVEMACGNQKSGHWRKLLIDKTGLQKQYWSSLMRREAAKVTMAMGKTRRRMTLNLTGMRVMVLKLVLLIMMIALRLKTKMTKMTMTAMKAETMKTKTTEMETVTGNR